MRPFKLLLVDDEESVLRSLERVLRSEAYKVTTAIDAATALRQLEAEAFDVIISDQRMPGMGGTELLRIVKDRYPRTIRIMLSGYSDFDSIVGAINQANVSKFLPKPWDNEELRSLVASLISQREADVPSEIVLQLIKSLQTMARVDLHIKGSPERVDLIVDFENDAERDGDIVRCHDLVEGCLSGLRSELEAARTSIERVTVRISSGAKDLYSWEASGSKV